MQRSTAAISAPQRLEFRRILVENLGPDVLVFSRHHLILIDSLAAKERPSEVELFLTSL